MPIAGWRGFYEDEAGAAVTELARGRTLSSHRFQQVDWGLLLHHRDGGCH